MLISCLPQPICPPLHQNKRPWMQYLQRWMEVSFKAKVDCEARHLPILDLPYYDFPQHNSDSVAIAGVHDIPLAREGRS